MYRIILVCICFLVGLYLPALSVSAQSSTRSEEDILRRGASPVWADLQEGEVQYDATPLKRDNLQDRDAWVQNDSNDDFWSWLFSSRSSNSTNTSRSNGASSAFWDSFWEIFGYIVYYSFWTTIAVAIISSTIWIFSNQEMVWFFRKAKKPLQHEDIVAQQAKYSDLPVELEKGLVGLKAQAQRFKDQGDYSRAIMYLFSYMLFELDAANLVSLAKGKTNYQYLRELSPIPALRSTLRSVVLLFEDAYFGQRSITKDQFDKVWDSLSGFELEIKKPIETLLRSKETTGGEKTLVGGSFK